MVYRGKSPAFPQSRWTSMSKTANWPRSKEPFCEVALVEAYPPWAIASREPIQVLVFPTGNNVYTKTRANGMNKFRNRTQQIHPQSYSACRQIAASKPFIWNTIWILHTTSHHRERKRKREKIWDRRKSLEQDTAC